MIRATTGGPSRARRTKLSPIRPSSASGKLQSHSYNDILNQPIGAGVRTPPISTIQSKASDSSTKKRSHLDRRLTLSTFDGIGENAEALTRLNTPASSMDKIKIEEHITLEQLHQIKTAFEEADTDGSGTLDVDEFKTVVKNSLGVKGRNEEQINSLFMKIDSSSDGEIDWDEFCTYMQLEYSEKEDAILRSKKISFILPASSQSSPHHKAPMLRTLCLQDSYLCAGQDGLLTFWSTDLKLKRSRSILESSPTERQSFITKPRVWVTDVAVLPNNGKLLVGTGERDLHFYEIMTFEFYCQVIGLDAVPLRINFSQISEEEALIVYGDDQVFLMRAV
uniref:WD repeat-containing protein on Y chromosome-like n=1 Tax=Ciona intestinalis TaxID=7719 RepID=UPI00089DBA2F|nr:WD repeat-containing protein on Y chromosome-like [Ciona intestinalis]|eukprot:XP_018672828.1 WD repeat-containing protein on Y chromosome-like [Ciona intestinalis]